MGNSPATPLPSDRPSVEIPTSFENLIRRMGYSRPEFVMQTELNESLFDEQRQNFLLLPMQETNQSIGLANEEEKQHQLIPGTPFQIWSFKNDDSLPGFAFVKVNKGSNLQGPEIPPPRDITEQFKNHIRNLGYSEPIHLMNRVLTEAEVSGPTQGTYFFIPLENFNELGLLTEEQKTDLGNGSPINVTLIGPLFGQSTTTMMRWIWSKGNSEDFLLTYALGGWKSLVNNFNLSEGTRIQLWTFNKVPDNIGFAVVIMDADKVQELEKARVIPREIEKRISGFRGSSLVFVMEMTLLQWYDVRSSVYHYLSLPIDRVEDQFLTDEEKLQVKKDEGIDAVLIGPTIDHKDDKEFKIKLTFPGKYFMYFQGAGWNDFVIEYGIKVGQKVRIWSFRRPCATAGSHLGTADLSEIGFAWVAVDQDMRGRGTVKRSRTCRNSLLDSRF